VSASPHLIRNEGIGGRIQRDKFTAVDGSDNTTVGFNYSQNGLAYEDQESTHDLIGPWEEPAVIDPKTKVIVEPAEQETLRDAIALRVLDRMLSDSSDDQRTWPKDAAPGESYDLWIARLARQRADFSYVQADAMLAARKAGSHAE
jgi:hypothetical protein